MSITDDIKARLDIVSYINQFVPLKKAGKYYKAPCPFHAENTPSFVVNEDRQTWRCFGACAEGGDVFSFAQKYHGWDFKEALHELGQLAGVEVRPQSPEDKQNADRNDLLRGMLKEAAEAYHKKLYDPRDAGAAAALAYARDKRGLSDETIAAFGVGYVPPGFDNLLGYLRELGYAEEDIIAAGLATRSEKSGKVYDRFRNRLMVPIRDRRGRVVGFGGRVLDPDDNPKYMNSPQTPVFDKSRLLFGLDLAKDAIRDSETAVIVEGYMDAITAHQAGFTNVVAQMGTAMTEAQLGLIAPKWARRVVLALDSDAAGQNATRRSLEVAREVLRVDYTGKMQVDMRVLQIPDAKDPDDLIREDAARWRDLIDNATPVADYVIDMEMAALPATPSVQEREAVARRVMPMLVATENNLFQQTNVQKLAMRLLIPERDLLQLAQAQQQAPPRPRPVRHKPTPPPAVDGDQPPPRTDFGEAPPPSEEDAAPMPDLPPDIEVRQAQPAPPRPAPPHPANADTRLEAHLLHGLLNHPNAYYRINGKLREVAADNPHLMQSALAPLGLQDFSRTDMRVLMSTFVAALEQDDLEVVAYMLVYTDEALHPSLEMALQDQMQAKLDDPTAVAQGDLERVMNRIQRAGVMIDPQIDIIAQAMRLRGKRLMREREELRLVQKNALHDGDPDQADACAGQIDKLAQAAHALQMAAHQVARLY
jgi:DNA primase